MSWPLSNCSIKKIHINWKKNNTLSSKEMCAPVELHTTSWPAVKIKFCHPHFLFHIDFFFAVISLFSNSNPWIPALQRYDIIKRNIVWAPYFLELWTTFRKLLVWCPTDVQYHCVSLEILKYHESPCEFPQVALVHSLGTMVLEMLYLNFLWDILVKIENQMLALWVEFREEV